MAFYWIYHTNTHTLLVIAWSIRYFCKCRNFSIHTCVLLYDFKVRQNAICFQQKVSCRNYTLLFLACNSNYSFCQCVCVTNQTIYVNFTQIPVTHVSAARINGWSLKLIRQLCSDICLKEISMLNYVLHLCLISVWSYLTIMWCQVLLCCLI